MTKEASLNLQSICISRRKALVLGASTLFLVAQKGRTQQKNEYDDLVPIFDRAISVREFAIGIQLEKIEAYIFKFLEFDYQMRRQSLFELHNSSLLDTEEELRNFVRQIPQMLADDFPLKYDDDTLNSQLRIVDAIVSSSLPIVPSPHEITPTIVASIAPPVVDQEDTDLIVAGDILLETIGISIGNQSFMVSLLESEPWLYEKFNALVDAISSKDWRNVAIIFESIFKTIIIVRIVEEVRKRGGLKALSYRFSLRLVPFVGWLYCTGSFIVSVKKNFHRFSFA